MIKFFLIGIVLQFFMQTFVTFGLGINIESIWLWKEIFILIFLGYAAYIIYKNKALPEMIKDKKIFYLELIFIGAVIISFLVNMFIKKIGISQFILAFKYDYLGFLIFFVFYNLGKFLDKNIISQILKFFGKFMKYLLVIAIFWYMLILVKPGGLKYFGYDRDSNEGKVGQRPPAVYKTQQYYGYARNQFLFERPINYGFFLVAFWPLFYMLYLRRKSFARTYGWWMIYGFNVISTFSRAAWIAWFIQIVLIGMIVYRKNLKRYIYRFILPVMLIVGIISAIGYKQIIGRSFSNTGHINLFRQGIDMFVSDPIWGKGAGYVGPASHWGGIAFNPENQYIQVLIEFGIIVFLLWMMVYIFLNLYPLYLYYKSNKKDIPEELWYVIGFGIGMIGLSVQGFFLHSFVDRMIVYPMMLLYGLVFFVGSRNINNK